MAEDDNPFMGYNKIGHQPKTLVGNWQEERALSSQTGVARYETEEVPTTAGASFTRMVELPTRPRVIEHNATVHPKDWATSTKVAMPSPGEATLSALSTYRGSPALGPRERMELEELAREAANVPDQELFAVTGYPVPQEMTSTYRDSFQGVDVTTTGNVIGARVMKDRDGRPAQRDPTFLAEHSIVPKNVADRVFGETAKNMGATDTILLPDSNVPITMYSEAVANKTYGGTFQGTLTMDHGAPFGKYTNFSKPINDYSKVVVDE